MNREQPLTQGKQPFLLSNYIHCHCGQRSPDSPYWDTVQEWYRRHGFGKTCKKMADM